MNFNNFQSGNYSRSSPTENLSIMNSLVGLKGSKLHIISTFAIQTLLHYGQFAWSEGVQNPYNLHLCNTDTSPNTDTQLRPFGVRIKVCL